MLPQKTILLAPLLKDSVELDLNAGRQACSSSWFSNEFEFNVHFPSFTAYESGEDEYQLGIQECKNCIIGRLVLPKVSSPIKITEIHSKLQTLWNLKPGVISPLGKGFFCFKFSCDEDMIYVRSSGADFNPYNQNQRLDQVWVRIYDLGFEYWRSKNLFEIASAFGDPLYIDNATLTRRFGLYAQVMVEVYLSKPPLTEVLVKRKDYEFFASVAYEKFPHYCAFFKTIRQTQNEYKKKISKEASSDKGERHQKKQVYAPKKTNALEQAMMIML
ncbi:uncharacterized protein LOC113332846 [Papaver somniferum]|uniref:uncharacterized protein LOC113332846 n=1 Tax=Papaver somniferum TaxID=3469 RepID=UPI000E6FDD20|nr:uncharacterized protein LOC113332846 [Papaver somniferum]